MLGRQSFPCGARPSGICEMLVSGEYILWPPNALPISATQHTPGNRTENRTRVAGLSILCSVTQWSSSESVPWVVEALSFHKSWEGRYFFFGRKTGKNHIFSLNSQVVPKKHARTNREDLTGRTFQLGGK